MARVKSPESLIEAYRKDLKASLHKHRLRVTKRFAARETLTQAFDRAQVWRGNSPGKATESEYEAVSRLIIEDLRDLSEAEAVRLEGIIAKHNKSAYNLGGANAHVRLGFSGVFNLKNTEIVAALERRAATLGTVIEEELVDGIINDVAVGFYDKGLNPLQVATQINRTFDSMELYRARRIARTETLIANEDAAFTNYQRAQVDYKGWGAFYDKRTRDDHRILGGYEPIPLNQPWIVPSSGEEIMHPGDGGASAEQIVNCRCYTIPVVRDVTISESNLWYGD